MRPDERDLDEEIRGHLAINIKERIDRGEDPVSARRAALLEFGKCLPYATRCGASGTAVGTMRQKRSHEIPGSPCAPSSVLRG